MTSSILAFVVRPDGRMPTARAIIEKIVLYLSRFEERSNCEHNE